MTRNCQTRLLIMTKKLIQVTIVGVIAYIIYHPGRHAKHYKFVSDGKILNQLVPQFEINKETNLKNCSYEDLILKNVEVEFSDVYQTYSYHLPNKGGEYKPKECNALFKTAILIPYRNRKTQLDIFLNYIHHFLQNQFIHYKIFIAEQANDKPFNRAMMFNYAAVEAMKQGFNCLILHDIDLIPLTNGNIYACSKRPRHMTSSVDSFRYNIPYLGLFGGAISILKQQFTLINGMSNSYEGWGGEDDDMYRRLFSQHIYPYRFSPSHSKYIMLPHKKQTPNKDRYKKLRKFLDRLETDGLNSLNNTQQVSEEQLYTHILVP